MVGQGKGFVATHKVVIGQSEQFSTLGDALLSDSLMINCSLSQSRLQLSVWWFGGRVGAGIPLLNTCRNQSVDRSLAMLFSVLQHFSLK